MTQQFDWRELYSAVDQEDNIRLYPMRLEDLVFEERVKMNCFYCKNYNFSWRCPPKTPQVDYKKMMLEYNQGLFVKLEMPFDDNNYQEIRARSTNNLHKALLRMEKILWEHDFPLVISFIGGSCKLCKNGCGKERCNNPYAARMPVEATGINVVKSVEKCGIHLSFPPRGSLTRVGLLLW